MLKYLLSFMLALTPFVSAQHSPVIDASPYLNGVLTTHADGSMTFATVEDDGTLNVQSFVATGRQEVSTSWVDKDGLTQTVTTEIPNGSVEDRRRALLAHKNLVNDMKRVFPPGGN